MFKITYDKSIDVAYIYFISNDKIVPGWVKYTYTCEPAEIKGMINLDFNSGGVLGGIEVQGASKKLAKEFLDQAEIIG
jgi:uncharacterized protein YuzE